MKTNKTTTAMISCLVMALAAPAIVPNVVFAQADVRQEDRRVDLQQDRRVDRQQDRREDRQADRQQERQLDRQQDRQMDGNSIGTTPIVETEEAIGKFLKNEGEGLQE